MPKILAFDWLSARAHHLPFCKHLETKSRFCIGFQVQHKDITSEFKFNRVGWQKCYGNRMIARREITEGQKNVLWETANGYLS